MKRSSLENLLEEDIGIRELDRRVLVHLAGGVPWRWTQQLFLSKIDLRK